MDNELINYLRKLYPITDELETILNENIFFKTFKKGTVLLKEGEISNECYFILKGCIKRYFMIDGDEKITGFYTEGQVVSPASYTNRLPSNYYLSCIENTIASVGNPTIENELYSKYPQLETMSRVIGEKLMVSIHDEFDNWVCLSPENRYLHMMEHRPDLLQRIPQYQLANYLGIKPQSLSRIRNRLFKAKP